VKISQIVLGGLLFLTRTVYAYIRRTCIYAVEHFILNIFACLLRRICIYFIRLFYITFQYSYFVSFYVVADKDVTVAGRARHKTRRCQWLQEK